MGGRRRWSPDLEAKDYGPDEAERESVVAVDDVMGAHVLQVNPLLLEELEGLVYVLQAVDPHAPFGGFRLEGRKQSTHMSLCRNMWLEAINACCNLYGHYSVGK